MKKYLFCCCCGALLLAATAGPVRAQVAPPLPAISDIALDSVAVAPQAINTTGWLLLDKDIQLELEGAIQNLYNFKFDRADKQFRSLRRRYPDHPMPYFLLGLCTWWKMEPLAYSDKRFDHTFYAYMDTAVTKAHALYRADEHNYEACFFLSAAYGFEARLHADRSDWRKATFASKHSLDYLQKSREANGLSPEFEFGAGLFDYYATWVAKEYPLLRPVLLFFPRGNTQRGLAQLQHVVANGFYTQTEAKFFLLTIYSSSSSHEKQLPEALDLARDLVLQFPDNSKFELEYAKLCFTLGRYKESEVACQDILRKNAAGQVGYEALAGRAASYILGYYFQNRYHNVVQAKNYYQRCLVFSETVNLAHSGYAVFANGALGRLAAQDQDERDARRYYQVAADEGAKTDPITVEAKDYLRTHH